MSEFYFVLFCFFSHSAYKLVAEFWNFVLGQYQHLFAKEGFSSNFSSLFLSREALLIVIISIDSGPK